MTHQDDIGTPTVLQHAERLLGRHPALDGKTDTEIKRVVVAELCDTDTSARSASFIDGAFGILTAGDARMAMTRRLMRLDAARRNEMQLRHLRNARPAGVA